MKLLVVFFSALLSATLIGCGSQQAAQNASASANEVSEQTVGDVTQSMTTETAAQLEKELGAFEITAEQRELAKKNEAGYEVLDAGRGNPNWINTQAREAFSRLQDFALSECELDKTDTNLAGHGKKDGIGQRFDAAMNAQDATDAFLIKAVNYCVSELGMNKDDLLFELCNGIIGDYYPVPSRCLTLTETILNQFLQSTLYNGAQLADQTEVFPTEGGSAAISYIFHTLSHNKLLNAGDKIAIATPIFTPYLQIPNVNNYGLVSVDVTSTAAENWSIAPEELDKLKDPDIKAFFLVNPSNPASHALSEETLAKLEEVVKANPSLIILTDDVYGTFVQNFQTVYARLPHNTILVYSYSKLYGATGWRLGIIAAHKDNVMDELLAKLPEEDKAALNKEYRIVTSDPASMKFIDRLCADSRSIGLYHTSGLSTPSQIMMDLFSLTHLAAGDTDPYIELCNGLVKERYQALMTGLGLEADKTATNAQYYTLVDVNALCEKHYGAEFADWKRRTWRTSSSSTTSPPSLASC
ncbi:MAG: bifunctional aspartate transaminase/aspartate 4-decarboxylase [Coriobacteriales bacterium]|nr:bifunctional aspartate transaminase/aspartate 4-decarboxylase [Coriobacteriales bacterium]